MTTRHDEFLARAAKAEEAARAAPTAELKTRWRELAAAWRDIAEQAKRLAGVRTSPD